MNKNDITCLLFIIKQKLIFLFFSAQSYLEWYANAKRLNRNVNGDGLLPCITEDIPLALLISDLRRKKWLLCVSDKPAKNNIELLKLY